MRLSLLLSGFVVLASALGAQTSITLHTTANSTAQGWTSGQAVDFTFTFDDHRVRSEEDIVTDSSISYTYETTDESIIWSNVTITGALGTWGTQTSYYYDPYSYLAAGEQSGSTEFTYLLAGADGGATGLLTPDATNIGYVTTTGLKLPVSLNYTGAYMTADVWVGSVNGTYTDSDGYTVQLSYSGGSMTFSGTTASINPAAVPEPASIGLLGGFLAMAWVCFRRRRAVVRA